MQWQKHHELGTITPYNMLACVLTMQSGGWLSIALFQEGIVANQRYYACSIMEMFDY
jgi:hypothetical protein